MILGKKNVVIVMPFTWRFLCIRHDCLTYQKSNESDEYDTEESNELGSQSRSFGTCVTCLGELFIYIALYVCVMPVGGDCTFDSRGE